MSSLKEKAAKVDGIPNAQLKWHDNFKKLPCFKLLLNATPSISQQEREKTQDIYIYKEDDPRKWIREGELTFKNRLLQSFKDLNNLDRNK